MSFVSLTYLSQLEVLRSDRRSDSLQFPECCVRQENIRCFFFPLNLAE